MASKREIRRIVNQCESDYLACWHILRRIREEAIGLHELLGFQPLLAKAIFRVNRLYLSIQQEKKRFIRLKVESSDPSRAVNRLRCLRVYEHIAKRALRRGKILGNSFAWLFYSRSQALLNEHLRHQFNPHTPAGVGGAVEYDFVKSFRLIGDFIPIYHGLTDFLRVGDLSFVDAETLSVVGIGELKSGELSGDTVPVKLFITAAGEKGTVRKLECAIAGDQEREATSSGDSLGGESHRLKRQLARQNEIITSASSFVPDKSITVVAQSGWMDDLLKSVRSDAPPHICQVSESLVLFALKSRSKTLFSRLTSGLDGATTEQMSKATQAAWKLATDKDLDNALWVGELGLSFVPGASPLLWTPINPEIAEGIFKHTLNIVTLYNPGFLISKLRTEGFRVDYISGKAGLRLQMKYEDRWLEIHNIDYMMSMIRYHFVAEESAVETLCLLREEVRRRRQLGEFHKIEFRFVGIG